MKKLYFLMVALLVAIAANASTVTFTNPQGWTKVYAHYWDGNVTATSWPGKEMTKVSATEWTINITGTPDFIIFNNGNGTQTGDLPFVDGATYDMNGVVGAQIPEHTVYFKNTNSWSSVYCYTFNGVCTGAWPGTAMTVVKDDIYKLTFNAYVAPSKVIFNNNSGTQTGNLDYADNHIYNAAGTDLGEYTGEPVADVHTVAIAGAFNEWNTAANSTTEIVDNCATIKVANWSNTKEGVDGDGFKVVFDGSWLTTTAAIANGEWTSALYDNEANMVLPAEAEGKEVTFTFATDTKTLKVEWTATPVVEEPKDLYIVGEATNWLNDGTGIKMTREGNVYTYTATEAIEGAWKICDGTWNYSFGQGEEADAPAYGKTVNVWFNSATNFTTTIPAGVTVTLTVVEGSAVQGSSIPATLALSEYTPVVEPEWTEGKVYKNYLKGTDEKAGLWVIDYTITTAADNTLNIVATISTENELVGLVPQVKINGKCTDMNPVTRATGTYAANVTAPAGIQDGDALPISFYLAFSGGFFETPAVDYTVGAESNVQSGISTINAANGEAVYYNMQGVRVMNPENGMFIVVRNGKATKEIVK